MDAINILYVILACLGGYLLGSIPFSVIVSKIFKGPDVREQGVKNPGGMNVVIIYGPLIGIPVLLLDFLKGTVTIAIIDHVFSLDYFVSEQGTNIWYTLACFLGSICCILGHNYSFWLKFDGGQGLGVYTGIILYINPLAFLFYNFFIIVVMITRKVNVRIGSLIVILAQVAFIAFLPIHPPWSLMPFNRFLWEPSFYYFKISLLSFVLAMTLLIRMIQSALRKSASATWRVGEKGGQQF
ncbi:MAG: glycerol-3-phosphate acyltransferase [Asgard group archaeon]|nr:glycerol-3-phosphate acyltransferase [Asgard group archaeon]